MSAAVVSSARQVSCAIEISRAVFAQLSFGFFDSKSKSEKAPYGVSSNTAPQLFVSSLFWELSVSRRPRDRAKSTAFRASSSARSVERSFSVCFRTASCNSSLLLVCVKEPVKIAFLGRKRLIGA
jgi:hypothetical protein